MTPLNCSENLSEKFVVGEGGGEFDVSPYWWLNPRLNPSMPD